MVCELRVEEYWIGVKLIGNAKSPKDAIGAKVFVTSGAARQRVDVFSGGSYGSSSDQRPHFGLGTASKMDKLEIIWPDGKKQVVPPPAVDQIITVTQEEDTKNK